MSSWQHGHICILTGTLGGRNHCSSNFTGEETEAGAGKTAYPGQTAIKAAPTAPELISALADPL
jgi:hypothetical protein